MLPLVAMAKALQLRFGVPPSPTTTSRLAPQPSIHKYPCFVRPDLSTTPQHTGLVHHTLSSYYSVELCLVEISTTTRRYTTIGAIKIRFRSANRTFLSSSFASWLTRSVALVSVYHCRHWFLHKSTNLSIISRVFLRPVSKIKRSAFSKGTAGIKEVFLTRFYSLRTPVLRIAPHQYRALHIACGNAPTIINFTNSLSLYRGLRLSVGATQLARLR